MTISTYNIDYDSSTAGSPTWSDVTLPTTTIAARTTITVGTSSGVWTYNFIGYDPIALKQFDPEYDTDTQKDDPLSILKRSSRGCYKGNSCLDCNNKRIQKEYDKRGIVFPLMAIDPAQPIPPPVTYTYNYNSTDDQTLVHWFGGDQK